MKRLAVLLAALIAAPASAVIVERSVTWDTLNEQHPCTPGMTLRHAIVLDADSDSDIGGGGGSTRVFVECDGVDTWELVSIGGGGSGGSGDVEGPASATDNAIARFDLTTGKIIQDSAVTIADTTGNLQWEGTTADAFELNLTVADPTADSTWNFTSVGQLQGNYIELAHGTGANFYADTSVTLSVNRGGSGIPFAVYNSDDGLFVIENQGASSGFVSLGSSVPLRWAVSGSASGTTDTQIARGGVGIVKVTSVLQLTPLAAPPATCDAGLEGAIYQDTSHATCVCDGSAWNVLTGSGAGSCA